MRETKSENPENLSATGKYCSCTESWWIETKRSAPRAARALVQHVEIAALADSSHAHPARSSSSRTLNARLRFYRTGMPVTEITPGC